MRPLRVLVLVALAAPAHAGEAPRPLAEVGDVPVASDGLRWALLETRYGEATEPIRVLDTRERRIRTLPDLPGACTATDVDRGRLLVRCVGPEPWGIACETGRMTFRLVHLATGGVRELPAAGNTSCLVFIDLGRHWIGGPQWCYHCESRGYLNWRTGRLVVDPPQETPEGDIVQADARNLDDPRLRPLPDPRDDPRCRRSGTHLARLGSRLERPLALCARRRAIRLSRCRMFCTDATLDHGRVLWREDRRLRGYDARHRRRVAWRMPRGVPPHAATTGLRFFQTRDLVWVAWSGRTWVGAWR